MVHITTLNTETDSFRKEKKKTKAESDFELKLQVVSSAK